MFLRTVFGFGTGGVFVFGFLEDSLCFLFKFFVLFLALEFVEVVVVILDAEDFLFDDFDFIIGVKSILILIESGNEVFVDDRMKFDGMDVRDFCLVK